MTVSTVDWALRYTRTGWSVIPLHSIRDGICTCGEPWCLSPGKHPLTRNGVKDASSRAVDVAEWWQEWPYASIGLATGEPSGVFVLDVDAKTPKKPGAVSGLAALLELEEALGELPPTMVSHTGGGGKHYFFTQPLTSTIRNAVSVRGLHGEPTGIDVRSTGGYVVLPPSPHVSGGAYAWAARNQVTRAPAWLIELLSPPEAPTRRPYSAPPLPQDRRSPGRSYCVMALRRAADRVRTAQPGGRHAAIIQEASNMGRFAAAGYLTDKEVMDCLSEAGEAAGKGRVEVERAIASQLQWAKASPKEPQLQDRSDYRTA